MINTAYQAIDAHSEELVDLAKKIWENPEMGWKETKAVAWTAEVLRANGFETEVGAYGMPTAIRAVWGSGKPVVGLAAEYDCLPGLSQQHCSFHNPVVEGGDGHGCGHNLLGAGCLGACIGLKAVLEEEKLPGTVIFYGCPAEEQLTGKGFMAKKGAFAECDFTITWHPSTVSHDTVGPHTGVEGAFFDFYGKTSHAATWPEEGISALTPVLQLFNTINAMRLELADRGKIIGIIRDGGSQPIYIPDHCSAEFTIRSFSMKFKWELFHRFIKMCENIAGRFVLSLLGPPNSVRQKYRPLLVSSPPIS